MCKSVPQTDATFTFTKTSVGPNFGMATSRMSAPGAASGFTTASIVLAIQGVTRRAGLNAQIADFITQAEQQLRRLRQPPPRMLTFCLPAEIFRLAFRDAKRLPLRAAKVLRQENNLAGMVGVVHYLAIDRLQDRMLLAANVDDARQIFRRKLRDGVKHSPPAVLPPGHHLRARG